MLLPALSVDFVTCNVNYRPDLDLQVTESRQQVMIYCLRETAKVKKKDRRTRRGVGRWEGPYLATSISTFALKTKGRTKEKYLLNYCGSWHTCFLSSVLE